VRFKSTLVQGVASIETEPKVDKRGSFARVWCQREFQAAGWSRPIVQSSLSVNKNRGTLRGLHFQLPPSREDKLVHCVQGRIFDVALDLRKRSPTFLAHFGIELSAEAGNAVFIPAGCAHGFLTLTDDCIVLYMMTDYYDANLSSGVRWNDPAFSISWPEVPTEILERDAGYPDFESRAVESFADN
jgi:dTDP-4-dehydrorhamnose 3,5-epimerase